MNFLNETQNLNPNSNKVQYLRHKNPLKCSCEKIYLNGKIYSICDICSERIFLKKSSSPQIISDSSTFSDE